MEITERQKFILQTVVNEYIENAFPISSDFLKKECDLDVSSATIRSELALLTDNGFLRKTYISSGRVPTDKGYRFFVDLLKRKKRKTIVEEFHSFFKEIEDRIKLSHEITESLSHLSSCLSITQLGNVVFQHGLDEVISLPEFQDIEYLRNFLEMAHDFENNINDFDQGLTVYIGKESPFKEKDFSIIVGKNKEATFGLLGPKRMDFKKNISLLHSLIEAMEE